MELMVPNDENSALVTAVGGGGGGGLHGSGGDNRLAKTPARSFGTSLGGEATTRKALGNITNQTSRRALGDITNNSVKRHQPNNCNHKTQSAAAPGTRGSNDLYQAWAAEGVEQLAGMSGRQQAKDRQLANTQDAVRRADWLLTGTGSVPDALVRSPQRWESKVLAAPACPPVELLQLAPISQQRPARINECAPAMELEEDDPLPQPPEPTGEDSHLCVTVVLPAT